MNHYQLYTTNEDHLLFSPFGKLLMQAYKIGTPVEKHRLEKAFPYYFKDEIDPKILKNLAELGTKKCCT